MIWLVLQAICITLVVTEGSIFSRLRTFGPALWRQLVSCSLCLGTWVGMVLYVLHALPIGWSWRLGVEVLGFGCVSGVFAFLGAQLIACLDRLSGPESEVQRPPEVQYSAPKTSPEVLAMMEKLREKSADSPRNEA
jgi:hypothetical protein